MWWWWCRDEVEGCQGAMGRSGDKLYEHGSGLEAQSYVASHDAASHGAMSCVAWHCVAELGGEVSRVEGLFRV